jgi:predicted dehydrogenase
MRIVMNGVTGRMGYRQHLVRSILAIRDDGGVLRPDGTRLWVEPVIVGRNREKLTEIARKHEIETVHTDLDAALAEDDAPVYFDSLVTSERKKTILRAIAAGKHVYTEKPAATTVEEAVTLARLAAEAGVIAGVVHDKLFLPGLLKLRRLIDSGFFGRILSVRGEFGYWVFEGDWQSAQRPSWNYRKEDGGGIAVDMLCHWNYVLEHLFGKVRTVSARVTTHIPTRWDEAGTAYEATADDAAYAIFDLDDGIVAQINSSWCVRVNREELVEFQIDGTHGSAVAGLRGCVTQHRSATPKPVWDPDLPSTAKFRQDWTPVPDNGEFDNGFKAQWELFLKHVYADAPYQWDLLAGARGVQLAELGLKSSAEGCRFDVPEISL